MFKKLALGGIVAMLTVSGLSMAIAKAPAAKGGRKSATGAPAATATPATPAKPAAPAPQGFCLPPGVRC